MGDTATRSDVTQDAPLVGVRRPGYDVPVIDERAVRAAAGILFLGGAIAFGFPAAAGSSAPLKPSGMAVLLDLGLRVGLGDRWSPTLALGRLIVRRQTPEWVGAPQKLFAWWLGFVLAAATCPATGWLAAPLAVTLALCGLCLTLLFVETAFGICLGCSLQRALTRTPPSHCPGGTCTTET